MDSIHNMHVVNTDTPSHQNNYPEKCLQMAHKNENKKYLELFLQKRCHFSPFVMLVGFFLGVEAEATLKLISSRLATKCKKPYYRTCGYVKSRVAIIKVRATHRCIQISRMPVQKNSVRKLRWGDGSDLHLLR